MRRPDVAKLFVAYLVTYTGTAIAPIAMAFGVLELTGSTSDTAIVIAAPTLAAVAALMFGGVLADRTSRQRLIVSSELLAMLIQIAIAYAFLSRTATVPVLTGLMLVMGVAMALNMPAANGLVIQLVDRRDLQSVNALLATSRNGAMAGGAALGGVLVATLGAGAALLIDAASFGISAMLVFSLKPKPQAESPGASFLEDLRLGWREFTSHTWLWVIVLQFSLLVASHESTFGLLGPAVSRARLNGATDWGLIASCFGLGTLVGGVISLRIRTRYPMRIATLCMFSFCLLPVALAIPASVPVLAMAAFAEGVAGQIFSVLWYTTLQRKIPAHMLSRVSAYDHMGSIALAPLGIVVAGLLFEAIGHRATLLLSALAVFVPTACAFSVRDVRTMTHLEDEDATVDGVLRP